MARYSHSGAAPDTTLVGALTDTATAITVASGTGYPTGAGGKFWIAVDPDTASEEHVLVNARTGTSLTLVSSADRGLDDTTAQAHPAGATIRHIFSADEADDMALQSSANTFVAANVFDNTSASVIPLSVNGDAAQSVDIFKVAKNGTAKLRVDSAGNLIAGGTVTVTGAATFAAALDVTGDVTTDGNVTVNGTVVSLGDAGGGAPMMVVTSSTGVVYFDSTWPMYPPAATPGSAVAFLKVKIGVVDYKIPIYAVP